MPVGTPELQLEVLLWEVLELLGGSLGGSMSLDIFKSWISIPIILFWTAEAR